MIGKHAALFVTLDGSTYVVGAPTEYTNGDLCRLDVIGQVLKLPYEYHHEYYAYVDCKWIRLHPTTTVMDAVRNDWNVAVELVACRCEHDGHASKM